MIPDTLKIKIENHEDIFFREEKEPALLALKNLEISPDSEFAEILIPYVIADIMSTKSNVTIVDISDPCEAVMRSTTYIHKVWKLPENLICFTSLEGEGGYIMDKVSGEIWDFDLADREDFINGVIPPMWNSFFEFVDWYTS